jgi:RNA polymerase sigma-70 factor (ECF subfamily)
MDAWNFKQLILPMTDLLYRFARSILQDGEEAKDAVQELSLKLWEKRNVLDGVDNLQAFAIKSMRNHCLDEIRKRRNTIEPHHEMISELPEPYEIVEQADMSIRIKKLIEKLPELQRTVIQLRDVEGFEIEEIAKTTGLTANAVTVNLSRARQKIREQILNENKIQERKLWIG